MFTQSVYACRLTWLARWRADILSQQVAVDLESGDFCCHDSFFFASMASDYSVLSASEVDTAYLTKDALQVCVLHACFTC